MALAVLLELTAAPGAQADERDFPFTYEYLQATKGERELAYHFTHTPRENFFKHELEFEYGISDRFSLAPYLVFKSEEGCGLRFDSVKLEARYRLGNFALNRVLIGLYAELEQPEREALEAEGKLILSYYDKHSGHFSFNYIFERQLARGAENEHAWSLGYARSIGKGNLRGGLEMIHRINTGQFNAGPVASYNAGRGLHLVGGYAFPLNGNDGNRGEFRFLTQYHF